MADKPVQELEVEGRTSQERKLRLAIAGCSHGEMDVIYETLAEIEREKGYKFDLLICCGDYQSVRNYGDLEQMHVKDKFKQLRTFYKYYNGERVAPTLTLFIGGNHEASGFLCELPNGGWVAPRIYYMGFANVIRFAGLRIGGLSGIFKPFDIHKGHYERPPFTDNSIVSAYHVRNLDVWRLRQLRPKEDSSSENCLDIMLTHDWPNTIESYGNAEKLLREKPFFREDIEKGRLGNPLAMNLLWETRPRYWFAAHMHCMFAALVPHKFAENGKIPEPTKFLALNKPIPHRHFLQAVELDIADDANTTDFFYDPEWLAVLRSTDKFTNTSDQKMFLPSNGSDERWDFRPTADELTAVLELGELRIPTDFKKTAHPCTGDYVARAEPTPYYRNPQSTEFCSWLGIQDLNKMLADLDSASLGTPFYLIETMQTADPGEIKLDEDEDFGEDGFVVDTIPTGSSKHQAGALADFQAPAWKGEAHLTESEEIPALKRRKVDFNEDE